MTKSEHSTGLGVVGVAGWQPIETAPKDGTPVLIAHASNGAVFSAWWEIDGTITDSNHPAWVDGGTNRYEEFTTYEPSHWMPLPAPPSMTPTTHPATDVGGYKRKIEEQDLEIKRLTRIAADRRYMMNAYRAMLGPIALQVAQQWESCGVTRQHTSWGPEAYKLSGEDRAQALLDIEAATATPLNFNDASQKEPRS